jgi:selenocysteine-specific elongation factor
VEPEETGRARPLAPAARSASVPRSTAPGARSSGRTPSEARPQKPLTSSARALEERLREAGFEPPLDSEVEASDLTALREAGRAVRVSKTLHYHAEVLGEVRGRVIALAERNGGAVTLAQLRDELGTSRKFAQALLEHFDSEKVTIRRGDAHVLRRAATQ